MRHIPTGAILVAAAAVAAAIANWTLRPAPHTLDDSRRAQDATSATVALAPEVLRQDVDVLHEGAHRPTGVARTSEAKPARGAFGAASPEALERAALAAEREREAIAALREREAIAALRAIARAQHRLQLSAVIDTDGDGAGEFGYLGELMGLSPKRKHIPGEGARQGRPGEVMDPPFLPADFGVLTMVGAHGAVQRGAYYYRVHLPDASTEAPVGAVSEAAGGGAGVDLPGPYAEILWGCYAWPVETSYVPLRTFFVNNEGSVLACATSIDGYAGTNAPRFDAALSDALAEDMLQPHGLPSLDHRANDGFVWSVVAN